MANMSYGYAGTVANDNATGDVAWTSPTNAQLCDRTTTTTVALTALNTTSQWLVATNFDLHRSIPSGATISGVTFFVEIIDSTESTTVIAAHIVKGGVIQTGADNKADSRVIQSGNSSNFKEFNFGDEDQLWGVTLSPSDIGSTFGVAIRIEGDGTVTTPAVYAVKAVVHWTDTAACTLTALTSLTGKAPHAFHAHAINSVVGSSREERVYIRWYVSGPSGWTMTCTDQRTADSISGTTRNMATGDAWGWNMAWDFNVAGTYTVTAKMYLEDGTVVNSNALSVTVSANDYTVRYYDPSASGNNDGTSWADAWQTFTAAINGIADNTRLILRDDATESMSATSNLVSHNNIVIERSNDGTNRPRFTFSTNDALLTISSSTNVHISGLDVRGNGSTNPDVVAGSQWENVTIRDCHAEDFGEYGEFTDTPTHQRLLTFNNVANGYLRYFIYVGGIACRYVVHIGNTITSRTGSASGEGAFRFASTLPTDADTSLGVGGTILYNKVDHATKVNKPFIRAGWRYMTSYGNWGNQVNLGLEEAGAGAANHNLPSVYRFEANEVTAASDVGFGRGKSIFSCNNVLTDVGNQIATYGTAWHTETTHNTLKIDPNLGGIKALFSISSEHNYDGNLRLRANIICPNSDARSWSTANGEFYIYNAQTSVDLVLDADSNVYATPFDPGPRKYHIDKNVLYTMTTWNARSGVDNEAFSDLNNTDLVASSDWIPTSYTNDIDRVAPADVPGVNFDHRGIQRNRQATTWYAGAVGTEVAQTVTDKWHSPEDWWRRT